MSFAPDFQFTTRHADAIYRKLYTQIYLVLISAISVNSAVRKPQIPLAGKREREKKCYPKSVLVQRNVNGERAFCSHWINISSLVSFFCVQSVYCCTSDDTLHVDSSLFSFTIELKHFWTQNRRLMPNIRVALHESNASVILTCSLSLLLSTRLCVCIFQFVPYILRWVNNVVICERSVCESVRFHLFSVLLYLYTHIRSSHRLATMHIRQLIARCRCEAETRRIWTAHTINTHILNAHTKNTSDFFVFVYFIYMEWR